MEAYNNMFRKNESLSGIIMKIDALIYDYWKKASKAQMQDLKGSLQDFIRSYCK